MPPVKQVQRQQHVTLHPITVSDYLLPSTVLVTTPSRNFDNNTETLVLCYKNHLTASKYDVPSDTIYSLIMLHNKPQ